MHCWIQPCFEGCGGEGSVKKTNKKRLKEKNALFLFSVAVYGDVVSENSGAVLRDCVECLQAEYRRQAVSRIEFKEAYCLNPSKKCLIWVRRFRYDCI